MTSGKTTGGGIAMILTALGVILTCASAYFDNDPKTVMNIEAMLTAFGALVGGISLMFARDNDVSDQAAGARTEGGIEVKKKGLFRRSARMIIIFFVMGSLVVAPMGCITNSSGDRSVDNEALSSILSFTAEHGKEIGASAVSLALLIKAERAAKKASKREAKEKETEQFIKAMEIVVPEIRELATEIRAEAEASEGEDDGDDDVPE